MFITDALTVDQRLSKATMDVMAMPEFMAMQGILLMGKVTLTDSIPTACTDGRDEMYNEGFVKSISDKVLRFVKLHEGFHKAYRHLITWLHLWEDDPELANQACDYVINGILHKLIARGVDIEMPKFALYDARFDGMDSGQVFAILKQEKQEQQKSKKSKGGASGSGKGQKCLDTHDWEGAKNMTEEEKNEVAREVDAAIRQGALVAGKLGGGGDLGLEALLRPVVNWAEVMREFFTATCAGRDYGTWRRPNRRYIAAGYYMPSQYSESVGEIAICVDASGSTVGPLLTRFMTELVSLCEMLRPERVRVLYWDTAVRGDEVYETNELDKLLTSTRIRGGGGTTPACVPKYMQEHGINPQAVVILTDGAIWGDWGVWPWPHLWCIADSHVTAPTGRTVQVTV